MRLSINGRFYLYRETTCSWSITFFKVKKDVTTADFKRIKHILINSLPSKYSSRRLHQTPAPQGALKYRKVLIYIDFMVSVYLIF